MGGLFFFWGWVGILVLSLTRGPWSHGGDRWAGDRRLRHRDSQPGLPPASPPLAGRTRGGAGRVPAPRRRGGRTRADRAGWAGDARRSGAPHRPRRLARAPTVPVVAGGGSQAAEEGGEAEEAEAGAPLAADSLPGSAGRGTARRLSGPGPRPRAPGPGSGVGRGCGRRGRVRGPEQPRRLGRLGAPAASVSLGLEVWVCGVPRGSWRVVGAAPPSPASGEKAVWPGGR